MPGSTPQPTMARRPRAANSSFSGNSSSPSLTPHWWNGSVGCGVDSVMAVSM